ncbi:MAG: 30S ribosomal protein S8 [Verrucomicrobiaceae bacterium]
MSVLTDPIADFLTRIRNATSAAKQDFSVPYSKIKAEIARILQEEGYIWGYEVVTTEATKPKIIVKLKYQGKTGVITNLKRVSTPGRRHYVGFEEIPRVLQGTGIAILSTPKGLMTGHRARKQKLGGELLALVW